MINQILIVDDDPKIVTLIDFRLKKQGYATACASGGRQALAELERRRPALVLLDIRLPDLNGVDVLKEIRKRYPDLSVIMVSAHADIKIAVECIKEGAYDFVEKPIEFPEFDNKIRNLFKQLSLEEEVSLLRKELGEKYKFKSLIGNSPAMVKVFQSMEIASKSEAHVLIEGESGTGKEMVARAIHLSSPLHEKPFVAVNCAAIPENLLEDELFGHEKGAFTGAGARKLGKFEQAQDGTLFLDEIGDLPPSLQVKLLRVLQEKEIDRLGGDSPVPVNARILTATNRNLKNLVREGRFREDLYFRINVFPVRLPPLRERLEDMPALLEYFFKKHRPKQTPYAVPPEILDELRAYHWPGNVRELENFAERLVLVKGGRSSAIAPEDLGLLDAMHPSDSQTLPEPGSFTDPKQILGDTEKKILIGALDESDGNVSQACRKLNISRDTFYRKLKKYSIDCRLLRTRV